jgi:plasmid stabilization system protein ParE
MIVRYSRRAQDDLAKILGYLDERSPRGARNVKLAIKRVIDMIGENSSLGYPTGRGATQGAPLLPLREKVSAEGRRMRGRTVRRFYQYSRDL